MVKKLVLPDTNVLILGLAGKQPYADGLKSWIENGELVLSSIVVAEFLIGATPEEEQFFNGLLKQFEVVPVDLLTAQIAATIRKKYLARKTKLHLPDLFIAAQCRIYKAALATTNPKDYPKEDIELVQFARD